MANGNSSRTSEVLLRYKTDKASQDSVIQGSKRVREGIQRIGEGNALAKAAKDTEKLVQQTREQARQTARAQQETSALTQSLSKLQRTAQLRKIADDYALMVRQGRNANEVTQELDQSLREVGATASEIDQVAKSFQRLSAQGTVLNEQNRRAIREIRQEGGLQSFGVSTLASVVPGGGGDIGRTSIQLFNLLDTIPKLGNAFNIVTNSITSNIATVQQMAVNAVSAAKEVGSLRNALTLAATALGPVGLAFVAVAAAAALIGGAFLAVTNAMKRLDEEAKKAAEGIVATAIELGKVNANIDLLLLRGDTEGAFRVLEKQFEDYTTFLLRQRDLRERIDLAGAERERARAEAGTTLGFQNSSAAIREVDHVLKGLTAEMETLQGEGGTLVATLQETARKLGLTDAEFHTVAAALEANLPATDALAKAEEELRRQREAQFNALQMIAAEEVRRLQFQQRALEADSQTNQKRLTQIAQQTRELEAQIAIYRDVAATNEFAAQEVERLRREIGLLGEEAQFVTGVIPAQQMKERALAAKETAKEVADAEKKAAEKRAETANQLRQDLERIALDTARRQLEAMKRLEEAAAKLESDLQASLNAATERARQTALEAQRDFQRRQIENDIKHYRALEDLRRKFERAEQDASLDRDFRRLFELRQQRQREFEDAARARQDQLSDEQRAFDQQAADRAAALQQERQDLIAAAVIRRMELQADYQKQLQTIRENQARQLVELSEKYGFELQIRQDGHSQEAALLQNAINAELQLRQQGYIAELALLQQFIGASVSLLTPRSTGSTSSTTPITKTLGTGNTTSSPSVPSTPAKGDGGSKPPVTIHVNGVNEDRVFKVLNKVLSP